MLCSFEVVVEHHKSAQLSKTRQLNMKTCSLLPTLSVVSFLLLRADARNHVSATIAQASTESRGNERHLSGATTDAVRRESLGGVKQNPSTSRRLSIGWPSSWFELLTWWWPKPEPLPLSAYKQWQEEVGYWIGEYSFYQGDGTPFEKPDFNYPYDSYKGFITGNIDGKSYRQRNVFLYPPQTEELCTATNDAVTGKGTCGINGNSRIFSADQTASATDRDGSISGTIPGGITTTTTLVGGDTGLLYQVFVGELLFQSQLTTLTEDSTDGSSRRTRTAQSFGMGVPTSVSFYRERRVSREDFYRELEDTMVSYNILDSDACTTDGFGGGLTGYDGGLEDCTAHLEESFDL